MIFSDYFSKLPTDLISGSDVNELKLLKLFAFNAYFNADNLRTEDVNSGCSFSRKEKWNIDGVFMNESLDEDTIDVLHSYCVGDGAFSLGDVFNIIDHMVAQIDDIRRRQFGKNEIAEKLLGDYLDDMEGNKNVCIRIITDYEPTEQEKYEFNKKISQHDVSIKTLEMSVVVCFADDILTTIESNREPFDYVSEGKLIIDSPNNYLTYDKDSIICNISAKSLKNLWKKEGGRGLLAMNLRYYIPAKNIDWKIEDAILNDCHNFWYLNNGIIIVCDDYWFDGNELKMRNFSIVNGGQTTRMVGTIPFDNDFFVSCKVVKNTFETSKDKNLFISKVAEASNTQKPIKAKDIIANKIEQRDLKTLMQSHGVFVEVKRGDKPNKSIYVEPWQKTKNNEIAQDLYSFVYMQPGPARNRVSSILQNNDDYETIFVNHSYPFEFLKDILFLEKSYREYSKMISKDPDQDPTKKGLVKNGLCYCLATVGYILKLIYNKEYRTDIVKYRNTEALYNIYSSELAFTNSFIDKKYSFDSFKKSAFDLFDSIFTNLLIPQFNIAKESNQSLAYSNWTKSNTGFNNVRLMINATIFDAKQGYIVEMVKKHFVSIDENAMNQNIDNYVDYCKKNKKIKAKDSIGHELNENDEQLRNELMIFRQQYCLSKRIQERTLFTDKMIDRMIVEKPVSDIELKKIISPTSFYYCGEAILKIILKYI